MKLDFHTVLKHLPFVFLWFLFGSAVGFVTSVSLFYSNKELLEFILTVWFKRILFGLKIIGSEHFVFWFILNNLTALLLIFVALILIMMLVFKRKMRFFKRHAIFEKHHPRITLMGLYILPLGALFVNGFLIVLFSTYVLLNYGQEKFITTIMLLAPHGINEIAALFLSSSLGLAYLEILSPLILKRKWSKAIKRGKELLKSKITFIFILLIVILVVFGAFVESILGFLLSS